MCELCNGDEVSRKLARRVTKGQAEALRSLADDFDKLSSGEMGPHSVQAQVVSKKAVHVIRFLAQDWL